MGIKEQILGNVETLVESLIEQKSDGAVDYLLKKLTAAIPGNLDDRLAAQNAPMLKAALKEYLMSQAHKIDGDSSN